MEQSKLLIVAMANQCKDLIQNSTGTELDLPQPLQRKHLLWMCDQVEKQAEKWPDIRLHRWIGFVQCGMVANRILDLQGARTMFKEAKLAYGTLEDDEDLVDHLDPDRSFEIDLGGQG